MNQNKTCINDYNSNWVIKINNCTELCPYLTAKKSYQNSVRNTCIFPLIPGTTNYDTFSITDLDYSVNAWLLSLRYENIA